MARLLVSLQAENDTKYERGHNKEVQGLIYNVLDSSSDYGKLHDRQGCKFFAFSNIFPFTDLRRGDSRSLLISSPSNRFITYLKEQLEYLNEITIGAMRFRINCCKKFDIILSKLNWFSLITITPIISRIQKDKRSEDMKTKACWSTDHSPDLFINQLQNNLVNKFNRYYEGKLSVSDSEPIFYKSRFLKQVSMKLFMTKSSPMRTCLVGTKWKFTFTECNPLLQFGLDAGLGELNSLGFGFMNVLDNMGRLVTV